MLQFININHVLAVTLFCATCSVSGLEKIGFLDHPHAILYVEEGQNITASWKFQIDSRGQTSGIKDFLFGEWDPHGYIKYKILYLNSHQEVRARPEYLDRVHFNVEISGCANCSAHVTLCKLAPRDFKKYGIDILVGLHRSPLKNSFELRAPPRITSFRHTRPLQLGNNTTVECSAKGIPEPTVKIQKNKQTLCNGTRYCQFVIEEFDIEDQGEYECIAKQGEKSDSSTMRLEVRRKGDLQFTTKTPNTLIVIMIVACAMVCVVALIVVICIFKRKNVYKFEKVEGGAFTI